MDGLRELQHLIRLKEIHRTGEVGDRMESSAEHTWACLIIAQHFLKIIKQPMDEDKVMKLILFHDLVEIESGDIDLLDDASRVDKQKKEMAGFLSLSNKIPASIREEYRQFFEEYEAQETMEAKFAKAMDAAEPMIHWGFYHPKKLLSHGWTEENVREKKMGSFEPFPEMVSFLEGWIREMKKENYL